MRIVPRTIIKAARALLAWSQKDLATATGNDIATIARFESGAGMRDDTMTEIIDKFDENGVEIVFNGNVAVGVRFKEAENHTPR
jgi:transcriptional regulator with XRE-family HTH domain